MTSTVLQEKLTRHLLELLRIPSVTGNETAIADHMEQWCASRPSFEGRVIREGNCVVAGKPDQRPSIALVGHLDTVPFTEEDRTPRREGDKIIGRGASDMKGSIAVMQAFLERPLVYMIYCRRCCRPILAGRTKECCRRVLCSHS